MDKVDLHERGVDMDKILQFYRNRGINVVVNSPVTDENIEFYAE